MYTVRLNRADGREDKRELDPAGIADDRRHRGYLDSYSRAPLLCTPAALEAERGDHAASRQPPASRSEACHNAGGDQRPGAVMLGQLAKDEAGVALALAVLLVVVIGVMGAGLLTLVVTDLEATVEANRGQRAFEMAEAGVEVARARLATEPGLSEWSSDELRLDGEEGSVRVTIERRDGERTYFAATSTGEYAGARRRIEATFSLVGGEPELLGWRELYE